MIKLTLTLNLTPTLTLTLTLTWMFPIIIRLANPYRVVFDSIGADINRPDINRDC